jgi:hypothetical protein
MKAGEEEPIERKDELPSKTTTFTTFTTSIEACKSAGELRPSSEEFVEDTKTARSGAITGAVAQLSRDNKILWERLRKACDDAEAEINALKEELAEERDKAHKAYVEVQWLRAEVEGLWNRVRVSEIGYAAQRSACEELRSQLQDALIRLPEENKAPSEGKLAVEGPLEAEDDVAAGQKEREEHGELHLEIADGPWVIIDIPPGDPEGRVDAGRNDRVMGEGHQGVNRFQEALGEVVVVALQEEREIDEDDGEVPRPVAEPPGKEEIERLTQQISERDDSLKKIKKVKADASRRQMWSHVAWTLSLFSHFLTIVYFNLK